MLACAATAWGAPGPRAREAVKRGHGAEHAVSGERCRRRCFCFGPAVPWRKRQGGRGGQGAGHAAPGPEPQAGKGPAGSGFERLRRSSPPAFFSVFLFSFFCCSFFFKKKGGGANGRLHGPSLRRYMAASLPAQHVCIYDSPARLALVGSLFYQTARCHADLMGSGQYCGRRPICPSPLAAAMAGRFVKCETRLTSRWTATRRLHRKGRLRVCLQGL